MGLFPSQKTFAPAECMSNNSAMSLPSKPTERAPAGKMSTGNPCERFRMYSTCDLLSITGCVSGIARIAAYPPAFAQAATLSNVSLCSIPGSHTCACRSTKAGAMCRFSELISFAPSARSAVLIRVTTLFSMITSACFPLCDEFGSVMVALRSKTFISGSRCWNGNRCNVFPEADDQDFSK
jgi:hypothetical protein